MRIKFCLCALLLSQSVPAAVIDFNDLEIGTVATGLNPYGDALVSTRLWVTEGGSTVAETSTRGSIQEFNGSRAVTIEAGPADATQLDQHQTWRVEVGVTFQVPVSTFSLDAYSQTYTSRIIYSGIDDMGQAFTLSSDTLGGFTGDYTHLDIAAPTGGYITGFYFSQFENVGSIFLAMDNLDYTSVNGPIGSLATVPETIGLPTFAFAIGGLLFVHRRIKAARK